MSRASAICAFVAGIDGGVCWFMRFAVEEVGNVELAALEVAKERIHPRWGRRLRFDGSRDPRNWVADPFGLCLDDFSEDMAAVVSRIA